MKKWLTNQKKKIKKGSILALLGLGLASTPSATYAKQVSFEEQQIQPITLHVHAQNLRVRSSPEVKKDNILTTISEQDIYAVAQVENEGILWFKVYIEKNGKKDFAYIAAKNKDTWFVSQKKPLPKQPSLNLSKYCEFTSHWEGFREVAYIDPSKKVKAYAIGYGTLLDNKISLHKRLKQLGLDKHELIAGRQKITKEQAYYLLEEEIKDSVAVAKKYVHVFDRLPNDARLILVDMAYNMSEDTFKQFVNTIAAFNNFDFVTAATEMKDSLWYEQVGRRSKHHVSSTLKLAQYAQVQKPHNDHPFG